MLYYICIGYSLCYYIGKITNWVILGQGCCTVWNWSCYGKRSSRGMTWRTYVVVVILNLVIRQLNDELRHLHTSRWATGVPRAPPQGRAKVVSKWPYEYPLSESGCSHQNNLDRKHLICIKQDGRRKNYEFTFFVISTLIDGIVM